MSIVTHTHRARFDDPLSYIRRATDRLYTIWIGYTYPFASRGRNLSIHYPCRLDKRVADHISIGNSVLIAKDVWLNIVRDDSHDIKLMIESNCSIGARDTLSARNSIHIEQNVIIATSVLIQDHNHAYKDISRPIGEQGVTAGGRIRIEQGCWIGQGAAIVCNEGELVIGRNSVVGANALVTRSFPPYSVIVGNPGRLARKLDLTSTIGKERESGLEAPAESEHSTLSGFSAGPASTESVRI
jgi:acetyltransferase-like isoleucine patch superfamily enzyme